MCSHSIICSIYERHHKSQILISENVRDVSVRFGVTFGAIKAVIVRKNYCQTNWICAHTRMHKTSDKMGKIQPQIKHKFELISYANTFCIYLLLFFCVCGSNLVIKN